MLGCVVAKGLCQGGGVNAKLGGWFQGDPLLPMERCLLTIHLTSLGALRGSRQRHQTHDHGRELPLRWDLLSQGRGLFLKQTLPRPPTDV